ncbi:MAG: hypothetical protein J6X72_00310, partial [Clostridia bacterium]|nr:hypothetical protein [Clostridia bacterium]
MRDTYFFILLYHIFTVISTVFFKIERFFSRCPPLANRAGKWYNKSKEKGRGGTVLDGERFYICIDLKSFYASVECVERGLDPMTARLVVADPERKSGTICLAVTPAMKQLGVRNRCRVFEIPSGIDYITAPPRMRLYLEYSARIYSIYLDWFSKEDIHVYSVDEVFIDVTGYLATYKKTPLELARSLVSEVKNRRGIPAAAGIGTNLYLCK